MAYWLAAIVASAVLSLAATPMARSLALRSGFVDLPAARKLHISPVPYLGGAAIMVAVLAAVAMTTEVPVADSAVVVLGIAVGLGLVGLMDDLVGLGALVRLAAQAGAAAAALIIGVRAEVTGVAVVDVALTVVWIVMLTNAFNMVDNMDGLSGGLGTAIAGGAAALAVLGDLEVAAVVAAAMAGATAGYLVWNLSPRRVFMGDSGSMFLGYLIAVAALDVAAIRGPRGASLVTLVLLVGVLLLDLITVVSYRYIHGQSVASAGKDHLSHRLVALGCSPRVAVAILVAVQVGLAAIAVAVGRGAVEAGWGLAGGAVILAPLAGASMRATVYEAAARSVRQWRVRMAVIGAGLIAFALLLGARGGSVQGPQALVGGGPGAMSGAALVALAVVVVAATVGAAFIRARTRVREALQPG